MPSNEFPDFPKGSMVKIKTVVIPGHEYIRQVLLKEFGEKTLTVESTYIPTNLGRPVNGRAARFSIDGKVVMCKSLPTIPAAISTLFLESVE